MSFIFLVSLTQYFELQNENPPKQSLALVLNFEKQVQFVTSNLFFKRVLNEKKATDIRDTLTLFFE